MTTDTDISKKRSLKVIDVGSFSLSLFDDLCGFGWFSLSQQVNDELNAKA